MARSFHKGIFVLLALLAFPLRAGNEVGGAGIAENNVMYAFLNLEHFIGVCLDSSACALDEKEIAMLKSILVSLPQERKSKEPIIFKSSSADKDFFFVDGQVRIARTGFHVGDPIYINQDLIYPATVTSIPLLPPPDRPLDIPLAAALLVHELGHHQGEKDHTFLDLLGGKINTGLRAYAQELDGGPRQRELIVTSYEFSGKALSELLLRDGKKILSVGSDVLATFRCPTALGKPKNFALWNLHWKKERVITKTLVLRPLRTRAIVYCESAQGTDAVDRELELEVWLNLENGRPVILKDRLRLQQIDCGKQPRLCN